MYRALLPPPHANPQSSQVRFGEPRRWSPSLRREAIGYEPSGEQILSRFVCSFPEAVETYCEWERTGKDAKM